MANKPSQLVLLTGALVLALSVCIDMLGNPNASGDWTMYMNASRLYGQGLPIYHVYIAQAKYANYYLYSPSFTFLLLPFTIISIKASMLIWTAIKLFLFYRVIKLVSLYCFPNELSEKKKALIYFGTLLFCTRFLLYDFNLGQLTLFLMWCMVEAWHLVQRKKNIAAAGLIALGLFIKMFSLILVPYFIYKKQFKVLLFTLLWIPIIWVLPFAFGRWDYNLNLYNDWFSMLKPFATSSGFYNAARGGLCDLFSAIPTWIEDLCDVLGTAQMPATQIRWIIYSCIAIFGIGFLILSFLNRNKTDKISELAYVLGAIPIIFPYQHKYAFVLCLPAILILMRRLIHCDLRISEIVLLCLSFALMVLSTDGIIGRQLNYFTQEYKFVTIGGILILIALVSSSKPKHLAQKD